jgi:hypothetical protein
MVQPPQFHMVYKIYLKGYSRERRMEINHCKILTDEWPRFLEINLLVG